MVVLAQLTSMAFWLRWAFPHLTTSQWNWGKGRWGHTWRALQREAAAELWKLRKLTHHCRHLRLSQVHPNVSLVRTNDYCPSRSYWEHAVCGQDTTTTCVSWKTSLVDVEILVTASPKARLSLGLSQLAPSRRVAWSTKLHQHESKRHLTAPMHGQIENEPTTA